MKNTRFSSPMDVGIAPQQQWGADQYPLEEFQPEYEPSSNDGAPRSSIMHDSREPSAVVYSSFLSLEMAQMGWQQPLSLANGNKDYLYPEVPDPNAPIDPYPVIRRRTRSGRQILAGNSTAKSRSTKHPAAKKSKPNLNTAKSPTPRRHIPPTFDSYENMDPALLRNQQEVEHPDTKLDLSLGHVAEISSSHPPPMPTSPHGPASDFSITINNYNHNMGYINSGHHGQWTPFGMNTNNTKNAENTVGDMGGEPGPQAQSHYPETVDPNQVGYGSNEIAPDARSHEHIMGLYQALEYVYPAASFQNYTIPQYNNHGSEPFVPENSPRDGPASQRPKTNGHSFTPTQPMHVITPNPFGAHMYPQMYDYQMLSHEEFVNMDPAVPMTPFQPTLESFSYDNLPPQPNGYYPSTMRTLAERRLPSANAWNGYPANNQATLSELIPTPKQAKSEGSAKNSGHIPWLERAEARYPRVWMLLEELQHIDPNYHNNPRLAFQHAKGGGSHGQKAFQIDWDQVDILNAYRQNARREEAERKKRCPPGQYIPKWIAKDYKPGKRLEQCRKDWFAAKEQGIVVQDAWTNRTRRTADHKKHKPATNAGNGEAETLESITVQDPAVQKTSNAQVQKRTQASLQEGLEDSNTEEPRTKRARR